MYFQFREASRVLRFGPSVLLFPLMFGCGTGKYDELIRQKARSLPARAASSSGTDAVAVDGGRSQGGQVLGGNRQSFLGQPLNAANRMKAQAQARQIGLALLSMESSNGRFPPQAITSGDGQPLLSWRVEVLKHLDGQRNLYDRFNREEPWDSEQNKALIDRMPDIFDVGYDLPAGHTAILAIVGSDTIIAPGQRGVSSQSITDGQSNTILFVIGSSESAVPWTQPQDIDLDEGDLLRGIVGGDGTFTAIFADGSVVRVPEGVDAEQLRGFFTKSGGEDVRLSDIK